MEMIPLREHVEALFEEHRDHVDKQFEDVKAEIRLVRQHRHRDLVSWRALIVTLCSLGGAVAAWVQAF